MKIGIVTINDNTNYGNRLQNYATQKVLKRCIANAEVYTIRNSAVLNKKTNKIEYILRMIRNIQLSFLHTFKIDKNREKKFIEFNKNIIFSKKKFNWFDLKEYRNLDYCISGSDQVWNPNYRLSEFDLLAFVEKSRRISFSASITTYTIPMNKQNYAKKYFNDFKAISVREDSGKKIVEELTGRTDVEVLVDPTMLLTPEEWDKVSKKPEQLNFDKYILCYFLGELSEQRKKEIERVAKENDCKIINILDKKDPFYETGPSEFLYLEKNAFLICTDSFHSSVFAILYNRPFIVFDREDSLVKMKSRLDTLIKKFELEDRWYEGEIKKEQLKTDYTKAYEILEKERKKSMNFLKRALDIE